MKTDWDCSVSLPRLGALQRGRLCARLTNVKVSTCRVSFTVIHCKVGIYPSLTRFLQEQSRPCCTLKYTSNLVLTSELEALRTVLAQLMEGLARTSLTNITVHEAAPRYTKGRIFTFVLKAPHWPGDKSPNALALQKKNFKMLNNPKPQGYFDFLLRHRKYKTHRWLSPE